MFTGVALRSGDTVAIEGMPDGAETAALVESMVEGVIAADERGRILTLNPAARRMLGYAATDAVPDLQTCEIANHDLLDAMGEFFEHQPADRNEKYRSGKSLNAIAAPHAGHCITASAASTGTTVADRGAATQHGTARCEAL